MFYISFVFPNDSNLFFIWNLFEIHILCKSDIAYNLILCFVMNFDFIELAINVYLNLPKP